MTRTTKTNDETVADYADMGAMKLHHATAEEAVDKAHELGMKTFNEGEHVFAKIQTKETVTLSVNFNGRLVTLSFVPRENAKSLVPPPECIDIQVHHDLIQRRTPSNKDVPQQKAILFNGGERQMLTGTLLAVLLNDEYLAQA